MEDIEPADFSPPFLSSYIVTRQQLVEYKQGVLNMSPGDRLLPIEIECPRFSIDT